MSVTHLPALIVDRAPSQKGRTILPKTQKLSAQPIALPETAAPLTEAHLLRMKEILRRLAELQRELFEVGYPMAGTRLGIAAEQIGRDVIDKLHKANLLWWE